MSAQDFRVAQIRARAALAAQRMDKVALDDAERRIGSVLLRTVNDEPTFQVYRKIVATLYGPQAAAALGPSYAQAQPKLEALKEMGARVGREIHAHGRALTLMQQALAEEEKGGADSPAAHAKWLGAVGTALSTAKNDNHWRNIIDQFHQAGAPDAVMNRFATVYSPTAALHAQALTGTTALPTFERMTQSIVANPAEKD